MMKETYNFRADLLDTYQSLPDWLKLVWALLLLVFILGPFALILWYKLQLKKPKYDVPDHLSYSVHHIDDERVMAYRYDQNGARRAFRNNSEIDNETHDHQTLALEREFEKSISHEKH